MEIENALKLSYYKEVADVDEKHGIKLVQHTETGKIYVQKVLNVYDKRVFDFISNNHVDGVPRIEETIEDNGILYIIEEYISGDSLSEILNKSGALPENTAVSYIMQICRILKPFHSLQPPIINRDIKPSNIIISREGKLFLVDFDSAKEKNGKSSDTVLIGTVGYAAPEQYGFTESMPETDIYALGVLLNEMLTGHLPKDELCDAPYGNVIEKCTRMDPADRYSSVDELFETLEKIENKKEKTIEEEWKSWLPPGFRSGKLVFVVLAILWYAMMISVSATLKVENASTNAEILLNRVFAFILLFAETLWFGNYRKVWNRFPVSNSEKKAVKVLGIILWAYLLGIAIILLMTMIIGVLK